MFLFKKGNAKKVIIKKIWYLGNIFYQLIYSYQILSYHKKLICHFENLCNYQHRCRIIFMNLLEWDYKLLNHCNSGEGFSTISQICLYWQMVIPCSLKKKIKKIQLLISNPNSPFSHFEKLPYGKVFSNFLNYGIVFFRRENIHPWIDFKSWTFKVFKKSWIGWMDSR